MWQTKIYPFFRIGWNHILGVLDIYKTKIIIPSAEEMTTMMQRDLIPATIFYETLKSTP